MALVIIYSVILMSSLTVSLDFTVKTLAIQMSPFFSKKSQLRFAIFNLAFWAWFIWLIRVKGQSSFHRLWPPWTLTCKEQISPCSEWCMSEAMAGKVCEKSLTSDPYGSNKPSPKCQVENGRIKLRSFFPNKLRPKCFDIFGCFFYIIFTMHLYVL